MKTVFFGTLEELQEKLKPLLGDGRWQQPNASQAQFRAANGAILNFFPSRGTISFQGKVAPRDALERQVHALLDQSAEPNTTPDVSLAPAPETTDLSATSPDNGDTDPDSGFLGSGFSDSEIVIGLVAAVGTDTSVVSELLTERLKVAGYTVEVVRVSREIIPRLVVGDQEYPGEYERISAMMTAGDDARKESGDNSILALGVAAHISSRRDREETESPKPRRRTAYIVQSLKHPAEVDRLREIYPTAFYLFGIHCDEKRRFGRLTDRLRMTRQQATKLMERDADEKIDHGQRTTATFHLSDFFVRLDGVDDQLKNCIWRIVDILMGAPYKTPTFGEFAMFLAFSSALRSADLSRQVGAVIARDKEVLATGANDCPRAGGGLYWPSFNHKEHWYEDEELGRDYKRGEDSNKAEQQRIIDGLAHDLAGEGLDPGAVKDVLKRSPICDLTEFGRVVHAEMEALLSCARNGISARGATLYCTTFPCHNCAKHIIASGITRVVYIEPYPKSKAFEFHSDSISVGLDLEENDGKVHFQPFVGVGPRRFFDLFSMGLSTGHKLRRKDKDGHIVPWELEQGRLRVQMLPCSYIDLELVASEMFRKETKTGGQ